MHVCFAKNLPTWVRGASLSNNHSSAKAVILGLSGTSVSEAERAFFSNENPLGFILFARNCDSKKQITALAEELRHIVGRKNAPILIDQEGGRVARLKPPHFRKALPAGDYAALAARDLPLAIEAVTLNSRLMAAELVDMGITVDCAPVADLLFEDAHTIIGDRSFGNTPDQVIALAGAMAKGLMHGGITPIIKHIPGHGRAKVDSHDKLPIVDATRKELDATDFKVFTALHTIPWAMTAHIIYSAIDPDHPATLSKKVIDVIRKDIGFNGILISDDLSMNALQGDFADRTKRAFAAGCDLVLHCNGKMEEMQAIMGQTRLVDTKAATLLAKDDANFAARKPLGKNDTETHLQELLSHA